MKVIFTLIYFLGLFSCSVQGVRKATEKCFCIQLCYVFALLSSFAGGLIRDIVILNVYPAVFTKACIPDVMAVIITAFLYMHFFYNQKQLELFITFTDSIGMAQFIVIGVDKALYFKDDYALAVLSGACTSLGGSIIIPFIFSEKKLRQILLSNLSYKLFSITGAILYTNLIIGDTNHIDAQIVMIIYTISTLPICGKTKLLKKLWLRTIHTAQSQNVYKNWGCLRIIVLSYIYSRQFYCKLPVTTSISNNFQVRSSKRIIYLYHRIRQM